jgi:alcohol dehydrogenase class IV
VTSALDSQGIAYIILDHVQENPPVESVTEMAQTCREFGTEFLIAIGGGASINSAKAISLLLKHPSKDPYAVFYGYAGPSESIKTESDIPVFTIPTTAGTGAEVTGFAVLTRADTDTKLSMYPVVFCEAAFLDPRYIRESSLFLLRSGAMDALAHGVETYLHVGSNIINRSVAEIGFRLFTQYKDALLNDSLHGDDHQNMQIASFMMGMAFMQSSTTIPHGMGYPLSHYKRVNHGIACAAFLGEYLKGFHDQSLVLPIANACGFVDTDAFAAYLREIVRQELHITVTMEEIEKWTDDFMKLDFRLASNPEPLRREDIRRIYINSLRPCLT